MPGRGPGMWRAEARHAARKRRPTVTRRLRGLITGFWSRHNPKVWRINMTGGRAERGEGGGISDPRVFGVAEGVDRAPDSGIAEEVFEQIRILAAVRSGPEPTRRLVNVVTAEEGEGGKDVYEIRRLQQREPLIRGGGARREANFTRIHVVVRNRPASAAFQTNEAQPVIADRKVLAGDVADQKQFGAELREMPELRILQHKVGVK